MPTVCSICSSPKRAQVDALLLQKVSCRRIAAKYHLSGSAIQRHKVHIQEAIAVAQQGMVATNGNSVWQKLDKMLAEAEKQYENNHGILKATWFREMRSTIETGIKLGLEAHKERQVFKDVTPAVEKMIEEAKG